MINLSLIGEKSVMMSLPKAAVIVSLPKPKVMVSLPEPPIIESAPAEPVMFSAPVTVKPVEVVVPSIYNVPKLLTLLTVL